MEIGRSRTPWGEARRAETLPKERDIDVVEQSDLEESSAPEQVQLAPSAGCTPAPTVEEPPSHVRVLEEPRNEAPAQEEPLSEAQIEEEAEEDPILDVVPPARLPDAEEFRRQEESAQQQAGRMKTTRRKSTLTKQAPKSQTMTRRAQSKTTSQFIQRRQPQEMPSSAVKTSVNILASGRTKTASKTRRSELELGTDG
ncbi:hypothetical protein HDE_10903 [Halotydeus destructor]|nr:hypothetical protein HDE_10903 [Halotydeus destructor]